LQERWKGVLPILWGRQLKQERLDELIYLSILNVDHLPDDAKTSPLTDFYAMDVTPVPADQRSADQRSDNQKGDD
jgi:glycerol-3-phosphate dehydrogenase